jgi:predicted PurR-regulated permease PerM
MTAPAGGPGQKVPAQVRAAAVVTLVALTVSLPIAALTLGFYVAYRLAEDYLLVPRVMGRTVRVPGVVSVVAVLAGGTLMGIVGALVAIPAAPRFACCWRKSPSTASMTASPEDCPGCQPIGLAAHSGCWRSARGLT